MPLCAELCRVRRGLYHRYPLFATRVGVANVSLCYTPVIHEVRVDMPRRKKERGRPGKPYPPRIDVTPEQLLQAMFNTPPNTEVEEREEYRCSNCGREVYYPEVLYRGDRCSECHAAVTV